jgi:dihydrofolate synthase/folylpolyglutamate synthase
MRFDNLPAWLSWQENLHFTEVDPGLERIGKVWAQLGYSNKLPFTLVTVAGTNGKGSSVAMLSSILAEAGINVGTYTSPHLLRYNERICIANSPCDDGQICEAFAKIDQARNDISLTYFEFATLAAALIFIDNDIDIAVLEVGMGGRLDAVNLFDADIALITPIGIDHTQWLGDNRELIAKEKAGVLRSQQYVVCSETQPPQSLLDYAEQLGTHLSIAQQTFSFTQTDVDWHWKNEGGVNFEHISKPALNGDYQLQNAAAVIQVATLLSKFGWAINQDSVSNGLATVKLPGRFQQVETEQGLHIFDVTHNHQGACNLASILATQSHQGKTIALLAMLADKDVANVVKPLSDSIDIWILAGLEGSRAMSSESLAEKVASVITDRQVFTTQTVAQSYELAKSLLSKDDRLVIFGSFHTVEAVFLAEPSLLNS